MDPILDAKCTNPDTDVTALENEIDEIVYSLDELTDEEIDIVEKILSESRIKQITQITRIEDSPTLWRGFNLLESFDVWTIGDSYDRRFGMRRTLLNSYLKLE